MTLELRAQDVDILQNQSKTVNTSRWLIKIRVIVREPRALKRVRTSNFHLDRGSNGRWNLNNNISPFWSNGFMFHSWRENRWFWQAKTKEKRNGVTEKLMSIFIGWRDERSLSAARPSARTYFYTCTHTQTRKWTHKKMSLKKRHGAQKDQKRGIVRQWKKDSLGIVEEDRGDKDGKPTLSKIRRMELKRGSHE